MLLVIWGDSIIVHRHVDLFLKLARGDVVGIDLEDLFAALLGQRVATGIVKALGFDGVLLYLRDRRPEF